ncbi:hypothetical protein FRC10_000739, partial [Ceratobasidium sp. 414]
MPPRTVSTVLGLPIPDTPVDVDAPPTNVDGSEDSSNSLNAPPRKVKKTTLGAAKEGGHIETRLAMSTGPVNTSEPTLAPEVPSKPQKTKKSATQVLASNVEGEALVTQSALDPTLLRLYGEPGDLVAILSPKEIEANMSEHRSNAGSQHNYGTRYQSRIRAAVEGTFAGVQGSTPTTPTEQDIVDTGRTSRSSQRSMPGGLPEEEDQTIHIEQPSVVRIVPGPSVGPEQEMAVGAGSILIPEGEEMQYNRLAGIRLPVRSHRHTPAITPRRPEEPLPQEQPRILTLSDSEDEREPVPAQPQPATRVPTDPEPNLPEIPEVVPPPYGAPICQQPEFDIAALEADPDYQRF